MLHFTLLVASMASVALGSVANFCAQEPFRQMQDFRDFKPAMDRCALHYPAQTITKTLSNACLTSTKTVILGTSTVHATTHLPCPTNKPHLEIRDAAAGKHHKPGHHKPGHHKPGHHKPGHHKPGHHKPGHHKPGHHKPGHHKPGHHHPGHHHPGHSREPRDLMDDQRRAGPTPVAVFKRDAAATKTAEWSKYYGNLAECGYDCIQTACSCVGTPKVELRTPAPTCTSTLTKETVVHETKTVEV